MINDISNAWFISDTHYNHIWQNKQNESRGVILFERTQFKTIQDHDRALYKLMFDWAKKHPGATLYHLGDFGDTNSLWIIRELRFKYNINFHFILGNHDSKGNLNLYKGAFSQVYINPIYIHPRIILSHEPVWPCPAGVLNVHGHIHAGYLDSPQHLNANIHMLNYQLLSSKKVINTLAKLQKASYKFLEEPYAQEIIYTQPKEDAVIDRKTGKINYEASLKLYNKMHPDHPKDITPM